MKLSNLLLTSMISILFFSCKSNEDASPKKPIYPSDQELITTVKLHFTDEEQQTRTFTFSQPDGFGGPPPSIDTIRLQKDQVYEVEAEFFDESNPQDIEDITKEIKEKDKKHLLCFEVNDLEGIQIKRTDSDGTYELGLSSLWTLSEHANSQVGSIILILKHQVGVKDGSCEAGETDVEVEFPTKIE